MYSFQLAMTETGKKKAQKQNFIYTSILAFGTYERWGNLYTDVHLGHTNEAPKGPTGQNFQIYKGTKFPSQVSVQM